MRARTGRVAVVSVAAAVLLGGCRGDETRSLAYGSPSDVEEILRANGVRGASLNCANPKLYGAVIRAVSCNLKLSPSNVQALFTSIPLAPGDPLHPPPDHSDSCEATPGLSSKDLGVEVLVGQNTRVTNGASRIELHLRRATGAACLEIVYPWSS